VSEPRSVVSRVDESAGRLAKSAEQQEDSADRRTELAADRTVFAAERTYAAWVRTGLAALASGVGAKAGLGGVMGEFAVLGAGTLLVVFSAFCFCAGVWREMYPGPPPPQPDARRISPAILLIVNALLVLVSIVALAGIWLARTPK
jgi:putative membrane protein